MSHDHDLSMITDRLILRDFREDDLPDVHRLRADPAVARFMDFAPETLDQSGAWLEGVIFHNQVCPRVAYNLAIVHALEGHVIGWIGIGPSERYPAPGELGFGYMLHSGYWGQSYMPEAVRALLDFGFETLGGRRISAWCNAENLASARVLEKAGLRFERHYQDTDPKSGQAIDCREYAIRDEAWRAGFDAGRMRASTRKDART